MYNSRRRVIVVFAVIGHLGGDEMREVGGFACIGKSAVMTEQRLKTRQEDWRVTGCSSEQNVGATGRNYYRGLSLGLQRAGELIITSYY